MRWIDLRKILKQNGYNNRLFGKINHLEEMNKSIIEINGLVFKDVDKITNDKNGNIHFSSWNEKGITIMIKTINTLKINGKEIEVN